MFLGVLVSHYRRLKKYSHNLKVQLFYLVIMFRTLSLDDSILVALRKLVQGGRREVRLYTSLQQGEQVVLNIRDQVSLRNLAFSGKVQASGLTEFILSYAPQIPGPILSPSCPLVHLACISPAPQQSPWGWHHPPDHSLECSHSLLEARNHWRLWHFLLINMTGNIFISHYIFC